MKPAQYSIDRASWLLGKATKRDRILELGPSYSPIAPKRGGWNTHIVDHTTTAEIQDKYRSMGVDIGLIEPIDSVWAGGPLHASIPPGLCRGFDRLIASHVIEHIPDLIGFFESASQLLSQTGQIALAVPDKRYCFDLFKPLTMTGDVLEAHTLTRTRHSSRTVWNQRAYSVVSDGESVWSDKARLKLEFADSFESAAEAYRACESEDIHDAAYVDCHAWQFVPSSFELMILELGQLGRIDWSMSAVQGSGGEFLCTFHRGVERLAPAALNNKRMRLLYKSLDEMRSSIDQVLRASAGYGLETSSKNWGIVDLLSHNN